MLARAVLGLAPVGEVRRDLHVQLIGGVAQRLARQAQPSLDLVVEGVRLLGGHRRHEPDRRGLGPVVADEQLVAEELQGERVPGTQLERPARPVGRPRVPALEGQVGPALLDLAQQLMDASASSPVGLERGGRHLPTQVSDQPRPQSGRSALDVMLLLPARRLRSQYRKDTVR